MSKTCHIVVLEEADDVQLVGGKAINLGALLRAGFRVPGGFVVTTTAFRAHQFSPAEVEEAVRAGYRQLTDKVGGGGAADVAVAVRSSATAEDMAGASMAGQYETFLDVRGEEAVLEAVKKCWQSISTPRTQAYLQQHNIDPANVAMAVVVQVLVPAEIAGVMFTVNPRTANEGEILIEASWGLGETVVSGVVQPDTVVLDWETGAVKSYLVGTKEIRIVPGDHGHQVVPEAMRGARCLGEGALRELHGLALKAHAHFEGPQDTEWAFAGGELYLLQSRAVTTLGAARAAAAAIAECRETVRRWKAGERGDWARHNLGETVPQPTPLTWSVLQRFMTPAGGFGEMYRMAGYEPSGKLNPEGFLDLIGGRIYMDLARAPEMFFERFPFRYDVDVLRTTPSAAQGAPTVAAGSLAAQFRVGRRLKRAGERLAALAEGFDGELDERIVPAFRQWVDEESRRDLTALDAAGWAKTWQTREAKVMDDFAPRSLLPSLICGMALENLRSFLAPHLWQEDPEEVANLLATGGKGDATLRSNEGLYQVVRGGMSLEKWVEEYGHRAPEEFDLATPRWRERPEAVTALAQHLAHGANPREEYERRAGEARGRIAALKEKLSAEEGRELDRHVALCHRYLRFREDGKHELMRGYELLRQMVIDAGLRVGLSPPDVCLLTREELFAAIDEGGKVEAGLIEERRVRRRAEGRLVLPEVIGAAEVESLGELHLPEHGGAGGGGGRLEGFSISTGSARGRVRIVHSPESAGDLGTGYVLVCRSTDPSWTPLFVNASGIVLECGGSLSHGAVVAREMGKPAVVLPNATQLLRENQEIGVDGNRGAVILSAAGEGVDNAAASPGDTRIAWEKMPPAAGKFESRSAVLRNVTGVLWLIFLGLVFFVPRLHLREWSLRVLDAMLWPVFRHWGGIATVAVIAGSIAVLSMVGQRWLTDTVRLREAKRRAAALKKEAAGYAVGTPRRRALLAAAMPVQTRVMLAAFVPLAVLLGPMVMSFLWLPERLDAASANARPGATAVVTALVDADYAGPVRLTVEGKSEGGTAIAGPEAAEQVAMPVRPTLEKLAKELAGGGAPAMVASQLEQTGKTMEALREELGKFLASPLPPQALTWTLPTPADGGGVYAVRVAAGSGPGVAGRLVVGNAAPPAVDMESDAMGNRIETVAGSDAWLVRAIKIRYTDSRRAAEGGEAFFAPFARVGWRYDFGWLGAYLVIYMVALFAARRVMRIP